MPGCRRYLLSLILLLIIGGCSKDFRAVPIQACNESVVPERVVATAPRISCEEAARRYFESPQTSPLQLTLSKGPPGHEGFRLIISNKTDHPVIFFRPQAISFGGMDSLLADLVIRMVSSSGARMLGEEAMIDWKLNLIRQNFSLLPPKGSCYIDIRLDEAIDFPQETFPPGNYQIQVILRGWHVGPWPESKQNPGCEVLDIGAWVGVTEPSLAITLTVYPQP